nr:hypothetical protein [Tanacetum cinerariifolium]
MGGRWWQGDDGVVGVMIAAVVMLLAAWSGSRGGREMVTAVVGDGWRLAEGSAGLKLWRGGENMLEAMFWSTAMIETTNQETKILATVDGKSRTISESSLRSHLKLSDEEGISSLPDTKLFENLSLMGYNILLNQRFTFQKGQFSHQWKFLIYTIMQCLSPKSTGFNEFSSNIATIVGEGSTNPTEPHHTPSPQEQHSPQHDTLPPYHPTPTTEQIPQAPTEPLTYRQYTRRAKQIAQSKALSPAADEPASLSRDDRQGEAFPTARVKSLEDKNKKSAEPTQEDAPFTWGIMEIREELGADKSTELGSNDTKEMVNILSSMEATNILTSGGAAASVSPVEVLPAAGVPTVSGSFPTINAIFTIASVVTPYTRRRRRIKIGSSQHMRSPIIGVKDKGKQKVVESEVPKKRKLQEQIDAEVAKEMEEEFARENQRLNEQLTRDSEIARLHTEEELKMMIEGLDRSNEVIAKHLQEYEQVEVDLSVGEKLELISELVKYQDHRAKILKYQAQQSKPLSKKEQRKFYMSVLRIHAGWKTKHFKGMTLKHLKEKFIPVWKQFEDFTSKSVSEDVSEEELKGMMQLVPLEEVYVEALLTEKIYPATKDKEKELWVELKRLFESEFEDQPWIHNQAFMHDPLDWKLYDTCGVHHVSTKDQEIFMLVERDYPLRRGLATVMISNKLQEIEMMVVAAGGDDDGAVVVKMVVRLMMAATLWCGGDEDGTVGVIMAWSDEEMMGRSGGCDGRNRQWPNFFLAAAPEMKRGDKLEPGTFTSILTFPAFKTVSNKAVERIWLCHSS